MVVERRIERRNTMPQELEDPEDMTIGEAEAEIFDEARRQHSPESSAITGSLDQVQQQQQQETSITTRLQSLTTRETVSQNVPKEIRNI